MCQSGSGCCDSCCCTPNPQPPCSTCPRLALVCTLPNVGPAPCAPPPRPWLRPPHPNCVRPWIPNSHHCHPPPLCSVAMNQPPIKKVYEIRYFMPESCGTMPGYCRYRTMPPPACAERLVPSKFMTMC